MCIAVTLLLVCFTTDAGPDRSPQFKGVYAASNMESSAAAADAGCQKIFALHKLDCNAAKPSSSARESSAMERHAASARQDGSISRARRNKSMDKHTSRGQQSLEGVSKDEIRRALAFVSACYPHARPSRGSLRQVYNFLLQA